MVSGLMLLWQLPYGGWNLGAVAVIKRCEGLY
jgi:hypothetical protein